MNRSSLLVLGALVFTTGLCAQQPVDPPAKEKQEPAPKQESVEPKPAAEEQRVDRRAQSMRDKIASGKQVITHVRVSLRLRNGNKMMGVVKDGRFVERVDGLRFVDASAIERGAGIRLWYSGGKRNYVFLPFDDVAEYEVMQRLTQKQLDEIELEMSLKEGNKDALRRTDPAPAPSGETDSPVGGASPIGGSPFGQPGGRQPTGSQASGVEPGAQPVAQPVETGTKTDKTTKGGKADAKVEGDTAKAGADDTNKLYFQLLQDYPPAGGWNKERRDEIARRKAVIGATPSEKEQLFVQKFAVWQQACKHFGVDGAGEKDEGKEEESPEEAGDSRKNRRNKR